MKRVLLILMAFVLVLGLAACAGSQASQSPAATTAAANTTAATTAAPTPAAPVNISLMRPLFEAQPPALNSPAQQAMEEALNVRFDNRWVPTGTFTETFNTTLATKDIPNMISMPSSLSVNPGFMRYCINDVFWDLTDRINSDQRFWEQEVIDEVSMKACAINGRNYYFPSIVPAGRVAVIYREDWRQAVNGPVPDSVDNFYELAKLFTENDPDGNGKKDTFGYAYIDDADKELAYAGFTTIAVAKGAPNLWGKQDGKYIPYYETQEYMDTLDFFKDMYQKGYMNEDFYLIKGNDKYSPMLAGKAGMMMTSATNAAVPGGKFDPLIAENPNAKIAYYNTFLKDGQKITNSLISVGALGGLIFPKSSNTEAQVDFFMDMIATIKSTPELDKLVVFGVEDIHYSVVNGQIVSNDEQLLKRKDDGSTDAFGSLFPKRVIDDYGQVLTPSQQISKDILPNNGFVLADESAGVMNGDSLSKMTSIATTISDARVQYIIGKIDEAGFKAQVQAWKDAGGQEIIDALNNAG